MRMRAVRHTLLPSAADDEIPALSTEKTMTVAIYVCSAAVLVMVAIGLHNLESWLERWDYDRHLED
jgi:hypothetical protein